MDQRQSPAKRGAPHGPSAGIDISSREKALDEAIADSFPASDPAAITSHPDHPPASRTTPDDKTGPRKY